MFTTVQVHKPSRISHKSYKHVVLNTKSASPILRNELDFNDVKTVESVFIWNELLDYVACCLIYNQIWTIKRIVFTVENSVAIQDYTTSLW